MFQANPGRTLPSIASASTELMPGVITASYRGYSDNLIADYTDAEHYRLNDDHLYRVYSCRDWVVDEESSIEYNYSVMTPNVMPHLLVCLTVNGNPEPYALYEPSGIVVRGEQLWTYSSSNYSYSARRVELQEAWEAEHPDSKFSKIGSPWDQFFVGGYWSNMPFGTPGNASNRLTWTPFLNEQLLHDSNGFQFPWDKQGWKQQHAAEFEAWTRDWVDKTGDYYRGMPGAKWHFYLPGTFTSGEQPYYGAVRPFWNRVASGVEMDIWAGGDAYNFEPCWDFKAYFFYPLLYMDYGNTGNFLKVPLQEDFPDFTKITYKFNADTRDITGNQNKYQYDLRDAKSTRRFGTPVWKMVFTDVPFAVDSDLDYFCTVINDGYVFGDQTNNTTIDNNFKNRVGRTRMKDVTVSGSNYRNWRTKGLLMWTMPKTGKDRVSKIRQWDGITATILDARPEGVNKYMLTGIRFQYGTGASAVRWKTNSFPARRGGAIAQEEVGEGEESQNGSITLAWYKNYTGPVTQYYINAEEDTKLNAYRTTTVLDGVDSSVGLFQIALYKPANGWPVTPGG